MHSASSKILLAEDHFISRHLLQLKLEHWGFEVIAVDNGEVAAEILHSGEAPPLAIIDWKMPGLDGLEVCKQVRADPTRSYTYLMLLTANGTSGNITTGFAAGADDYIVKPFDSNELRARLRIGFRVAALQRRLREVEGALSKVRQTHSEAAICM